MGFDRSYIPVGLVEPKIWGGKESIPKNAKSILEMGYTTADIGDKSANRGSTNPNCLKNCISHTAPSTSTEYENFVTL